MLLFRIKLAWFAARQGWRQAPLAVEAVRHSCDTGNGWNAGDYSYGFIDLFSPCYDMAYRGDKDGK